MDDVPTPMERLLRLEACIEQLNRQLLQAPDAVKPGEGRPTRQVWPADEQLLTRCLRRTPQVVQAYQSGGELTATEGGGVLLEPSAQQGLVHLCELNNGDAVAWLTRNAPDNHLGLSAIGRIFAIPAGVTRLQELTIQRLPLFKPIVLHNRWTLARRGELTRKGATCPEESANEAINGRLERLERAMSHLSARHEDRLRELQVKLETQQKELDQLLRLKRP